MRFFSSAKNEFSTKKCSCSAAERMAWTEEEFSAYEDAIVKATDTKGSIEFAFEDGEKKGKIKGVIEGEQKGKIQIAQSLIKSGKLSIEDISQATGLSVSEIEQLKKTII